MVSGGLFQDTTLIQLVMKKAEEECDRNKYKIDSSASAFFAIEYCFIFISLFTISAFHPDLLIVPPGDVVVHCGMVVSGSDW